MYRSFLYENISLFFDLSDFKPEGLRKGATFFKNVQKLGMLCFQDTLLIDIYNLRKIHSNPLNIIHLKLL